MTHKLLPSVKTIFYATEYLLKIYVPLFNYLPDPAARIRTNEKNLMALNLVKSSFDVEGIIPPNQTSSKQIFRNWEKQFTF